MPMLYLDGMIISSTRVCFILAIVEFMIQQLLSCVIKPKNGSVMGGEIHREGMHQILYFKYVD